MQEHYCYYYSSFPMGKASRIMRKSVFTFLQNFQFFTSAPSLLAVPFAVSALLSQPLVSSSSSSRLSSHGPLLLLSATGAIIYSIILANAYIICNLALLVSGIERQGGFNSILKACVLIRGRTATALSLAVPINMALAAVEALFQYRVVRAYRQATTPDSSMVLEAMLIAYLYAILLVLDTILGFAFLKSCKPDYQIDHIEIQERNDKSLRKIKGLELLL
ncbi:UNVERIFIED_CONTAM: hypothetical protein Sradi_0160900 [Sesamum radiatum]|uniref:Uncharacterized protein n=1 Tax=Sesamum radiatum TaxID=300843 RepID=A0AAW2WLF3_SESRA